MNLREKQRRKSDAQQRVDRLTEVAILCAAQGRGFPSGVVDETAFAVRRGGKLDEVKAPPAFARAVGKGVDLIEQRAAEARADGEARRRLADERTREWLEL